MPSETPPTKLRLAHPPRRAGQLRSAARPWCRGSSASPRPGRCRWYSLPVRISTLQPSAIWWLLSPSPLQGVSVLAMRLENIRADV